MVWRMGFKDEQQQYFESQIQQRILFIPNLSEFLGELNKQILKLPHEIQDPNQNFPMGTKYSDIINSFVNGVEVAYSNLAPYRLLAKDGFTPSKEYAEKDDFNKSLEKLEWIYSFLENSDMLNARTIEMRLPDSEDDYDDSVKREVPPPKQPADAKAVGAMEKQN